MIRKLYVLQYNTLVIRGRYPAKGARELLAGLYAENLPFLILTDQSGRTREEIVRSMMDMGFYHIPYDGIYTSTMAAADWVARQYPEKAKAAYIGGRGMKKSLEEAGFAIVNAHPDWLFVGFDRNATYEDYSFGLSLIRSGAALISTDSSPTRFGETGEGIGAGAIVKMLEYASGTRALEFGRPGVISVASALRYQGYEAKEAIFVGADFKLDIVPALRCGMDTVLVTEGRSIQGLGMNEKMHPRWIIDDLSGLLR